MRGFQPATDKQIAFMKTLGLPIERAKTIAQASKLLDAKLQPLKAYSRLLRKIAKASNELDLTIIDEEVTFVHDVLPNDLIQILVRVEKERQKLIAGKASA